MVKKIWLSLLIVATLFVGCITTNNVALSETAAVRFDNCTPYMIGWVFWIDYGNEYEMCDPNLFIQPQEHRTVVLPVGIYSFTVWDAQRDIIEDYFELQILEDTTISLGCTTATNGPGPWVVMQ